MKKVLVVTAHDDDSILGVGGRILRHLSEGDEVYVVICHDGRTSHRAVFKREERPSLHEVGEARRREETVRAMMVMNVNNWEMLSLSGEEARPSQNVEEAESELRKRFESINPDVVYYHLADAHPDHRAVAEIMGRIVADSTAEAFQFMIWTRELAQVQGQSNMDPSQAPNIPENAIRFWLNKAENFIKDRALHCMTSQISTWPYPDWDPQPRAILEEPFLRYFLRGEEIIIPV
jgi:LmbE family N-acetylglucosaminyl deacetylase